jgi:CheY-like chemotaxis protein
VESRFELTGDSRRRLRVVLADDHAPTRALLEALFSMSPSLELVGSCPDGAEAVAVAVAERADVVVLDLNMPRLDGLAAAKALHRFLPDSHQVLFTSEPQSEAAVLAAALDVPVLDKLAADDLVLLLEREERFHLARSGSGPAVDKLVLAALAGGREEATAIIRSDSTVAFYNPKAAEMLELPFPPEPDLDFERMSGQLDTVFRDGTPRALETTPVSVALFDRRPASDEVCHIRNGRICICASRALPFFDEDGTFLGAAAYWTHVAYLAAPAAR